MEKINFNFEAPQDPYVEVYDPEDKLVMRTNDDIKFLYLCCQINDAHAEGYYVVVPDEMKKIRENNPDAETVKHEITPHGRCRVGNSNMFHVHGDLLRKLI